MLPIDTLSKKKTCMFQPFANLKKHVLAWCYISRFCYLRQFGWLHIRITNAKYRWWNCKSIILWAIDLFVGSIDILQCFAVQSNILNKITQNIPNSWHMATIPKVSITFCMFFLIAKIFQMVMVEYFWKHCVSCTVWTISTSSVHKIVCLFNSIHSY